MRFGMPFFILFIIFLLPIIVGFTYVRADANRIGQPGWLWAILTIPLGWLTLLIYAILRWFAAPRV
ncbi:MAG: hypothetical protein KGO05_10535 [Chloroflexota bacterium]|nr:hypothetical protein [Chloroflexota bacterium]